jgi:hypothetical protein
MGKRVGGWLLLRGDTPQRLLLCLGKSNQIENTGSRHFRLAYHVLLLDSPLPLPFPGQMLGLIPRQINMLVFGNRDSK